VDAAVIGKSLRERLTLVPIAPERAVALVQGALKPHAAPLVSVRAQGAGMIACLVIKADEATVRRCLALGFELERGGDVVVGLAGEDAARLFQELRAEQRAWLEAPSGPRQTKVLLFADGVGLVSIEASGGTVVVTAAP
jgi:hypothetical protein